MISCSNNQAIERAQPWLGTLVSIRVEGLSEIQAHRAINLAFADIATVHRLMSFHDPASEVSRLNREAARRSIAVHPWTYSVLREAQQFSRASNGSFDISVASELVAWGMLPAPRGTQTAPCGSWRDIELLPASRVAFHRPLWIDLGGIAKGFAVDRATERLRQCGAQRTVVNAGGDIRVERGDAELICLGASGSTAGAPVLELADGSVAGSSGALRKEPSEAAARGPHVDGSHRKPAPVDRFVCVAAEQCVVADALTKVVMARGLESVELLEQFCASAYIKDPNREWLCIGAMETEAV